MLREDWSYAMALAQGQSTREDMLLLKAARPFGGRGC